jgi:2-polyprenyl-3-methyl-5-hydroxy-6-metoxy-1,4-benzoquinol methylase
MKRTLHHLARFVPIGDNSDIQWEKFGKSDPYYGVVSWPEFRAKNMSDDAKRRFFALGADHVERILAIIEEHFGGSPRGTCLDFGCGVGRLVIPFSRKFSSVVGVDVSESMISEAKKNCADYSITNVTFSRSLDQENASYDLVHTYIVLQHIPLARGMTIIDRLIALAKPGGLCVIHVTIGRDAGMLRKLATSLHKNVKPIHWLLNIAAGRPVFEPFMQSNAYSLKDILIKLSKAGITKMWLETECHSGAYSALLVFRGP